MPRPRRAPTTGWSRRARTATGRPLLANDPAPRLGVPSLRYVVHLSAPGLSLIGAGEPALPGVTFGHNDDGAFGITIFGIDQEDLYVYELNPADPHQYRYGDGWEEMTVVREKIPVKGEAPRDVELRFTRHGPVIDFDPAHRRAFALRTVWAQPGASAYFEASWSITPATWNDFKAALDHWGAPPLNFVYADRSGAIGWAAAGLTPRRPNWDGLMPVPGDGRYEWQGFLAGDELPVSLQPGQGLVRHRQRDEPARRISGRGAQGLLRVGRPLAHRPHRRGAGRQPSLQCRRRHGPADRQPSCDRAPAARSRRPADLARSPGGRRPGPAEGLGRRGDHRQRPGRHLRGLGGQASRPGGGRPPRSRRQAGHRDPGPRRHPDSGRASRPPVRRRSCSRPRRPPAGEPEGRPGRAHRAARAGHGRLGAGAGCTTPPGRRRSRPWPIQPCGRG